MASPITILILILASLNPTTIYWTSKESVAKYVTQNEMVLIEFWGTWCPECRKDFNKTLETARRYPKAKVLMVALSDNAQDIREFVKDKNIPSNVLIAMWLGASPVKTIPRFRAYYKGRMILETDTLDKLRKALEGY